MSTNKEHTKKLKDLLNKTIQEKQTESDDFEKEALEGFATLKSEAEALELKNSLDTKIYSEVFVSEKQHSGKRYWLAAAALIGAIGFTIYFFQSYVGVKDSNLAIHPHSADQEQEQKISPLPNVTQSISQISNSDPLTRDNKRTEGENKSKSLQATEAPKALSMDKVKVMQGEAAAPAFEDADALTATEEQTSATKKEDQQTQAVVTKEIDTEASDKKSRTEVKESAGKKAKLSETEKTLPAAAPQMAYGAATTISNKDIPTTCYYKGGEVQLQRDLSKQLNVQKINKKFEAILYITNSGKVEKVKLIQVSELTTSEQEKLSEILTSLSKFEVNGTKETKQLVEYPIAFKP